MAANLVRRYEPDAGPPPPQPVLRPVPGRPGRRAARGADRAPAAAPRAPAGRGRPASAATSTEYRAPAPGRRAGAARPAPASAGSTASTPPWPRLQPGDVVVLGGARLAVLSVAFRKGDPRLHTVDEQGKPRTLARRRPRRAAARRRADRAAGAVQPRTTARSSTRSATPCVGAALDAGRPPRRPRTRRGAATPVDEAAPRGAMPTRWPTARIATPTSASAVQAERVERELDDLRRQVRGRTESLARRFDRVLRLLEAWGYLDGWALTEAGTVLARTYHEADLLVAEAMTSGPARRPRRPVAGRAGVVLHLRAPGPRAGARATVPVVDGAGALPGARAHRRASSTADEEEAGLPTTRAPDPGFVHLAHAWAAGERPRRRARGRGALGRRLRPQRQAAHRPAARHRRRRARCPPPPRAPGRRPTRCTAAWCRRRRPSRRRTDPEDGMRAPGDDPEG